MGGSVGNMGSDTFIHWSGYVLIQAYLGYRWSL